MKVPILVIFFYLFCSFCSAQTRNPALDINRANIWRFGTTSSLGANDVPALDFSSGVPVVINSGNNPVRQGATATTNDNILQLYGGDQSIFDRTDNLLSNSGVVGDSGWIGISPCNLAIPMPNSPNLVYYFSAQVSLKYSVVDMSLNNGFGQAVVRNVTLEQIPVEAKLAAVHHCNGSDVWIVGHRWGTDTFYAYLLTDTGINASPVATKIGPVSGEQGYWQAGRMKFSTDGNKLAIVFGGADVLPYLFDFDKSTGIISDPIALQKDRSDNGLSFSPDNSKLYISTNNGLIVQYDLNAGSVADIANSKKIILNAFTDFPIMQLARDGKIYVMPGGLPHSRYLTVIHEPNNLDTLCQPQFDAIYLNGAKGYVRSLMNTLESYFYAGSSAYPCYGDTVTNVTNIPDREGVQVKVYPNPFSDYTFIDVLGVTQQDNLKCEVFDVSGRVCPVQISESDWWNGKRMILHKARLPSGIYFLTVTTINQSKTIKLSIL